MLKTSVLNNLNLEISQKNRLRTKVIVDEDIMTCYKEQFC